MKKTNTLETIQKIQASARHCPEVRAIEEMKIGQVVRQGDIYVECIAEIEGRGGPIVSRQLAPGNSKGSRHIVDESPSVTLWESKPDLGDRARFQVGPAIEAKGSFSITHPEHAFCKLPAGNYQVWFQADFARKERAQD